MLVQPSHEHRAVARFVLGKVQAASQRRVGGQAGFDPPAPGGIHQLMGYVVLAQDGQCRRGEVKIPLGAEQLQIAARLLVLDLEFRAQPVQAVAAVERQALHAQLVGAIALRLALAQPAADPAPHGRIGAGPEDNGGFALEQRPQDLTRHARCGPRRDIARRDHTGIAEAGLLRRRAAPLEHRHGETGLAQIPGRAHADHAGTDHDHMHLGGLSLCR
ncbi:hypothetical protein D3C86_1105720 [compost metagenome]